MFDRSDWAWLPSELRWFPSIRWQVFSTGLQKAPNQQEFSRIYLQSKRLRSVGVLEWWLKVCYLFFNTPWLQVRDFQDLIKSFNRLNVLYIGSLIVMRNRFPYAPIAPYPGKRFSDRQNCGRQACRFNDNFILRVHRVPGLDNDRALRQGHQTGQAGPTP